MDLKFLDDTNNSNNDNELEKLKKENILLKQQLADARADNFLKLYQDLQKENSEPDVQNSGLFAGADRKQIRIFRKRFQFRHAAARRHRSRA